MSDNKEVPDGSVIFHDDVFVENNKNVSQEWVSIRKLYPNGADEPLLPETFSREQFGQGNHYECFMLSALSTLIRFPDIIRNCFVTKEVRQDGRYTFQFFRGREWVKVEIDDTIALEDGEVLYIQSPTEHWWPLLLEKAYAKFYMSYDHLEGCTLQETYHDLTGNPVLNIPMDAKLAKAANAEVTEGSYWLDLAQKIQAGQLVASVLTKDMDVENMGLQREQQYGVLEIFSITGTSSVNDIVIRLHNPFEDEEYEYKGPLNRNDAAWTPKLRTKYSVDDVRSIFLPLNTFLKIMNSLQLCFVDAVEREATYFYDEWKGETAGGNPTSVTWRKNPLYYVRNTGTTPAEIIVVIKQEDQRRFTSPDEMTKYLQCGVVLVQYVYSHPLPTFYITGNNHKLIYKSLFLNSREVANTMTIPPNSLCYLVPSCMLKGAEGEFSLAVYGMKNVDYDDLTIKKLVLPNIEWDSPANRDVVLRQKEKDRVDFYVDVETDVHILMHQQKPFISKTGGDAMTEDYMGMYLYDDRDHKISGVHAATNFREVSIIHHLPRSGRYALSITCPRAKDEVPAFINIVGSSSSNLRIVDAPADATMFDDDDEIIEEGDGGAEERNPIDYLPVTFEKTRITEAPDSNTPFEDKRFMVNNKNVTDEPWVHIGDLYPEGKKQPLLPEILSRDQFEQGEHYECCCLTAFAAVVDHHPDVIRSCFITKNPRKDGRYTFQFHRYGHWVKIEIDDRIPLSGGNTLYCRSPTRHWWPLLLEKAYAKFYTLYQNIEGCTQQEVLHDFTGRPVISIPTDLDLAKAALYDVDDAQFWLDLNEDLQRTAIAALTRMEKAEPLGMQDDQSYSVLGFVPMRNATDLALSEILVKLYNPFEESTYTGPMNRDDAEWPEDMRVICAPEDRHFIYMPVNIFREVFLNMQQVLLGGLVEPSHNFHSEWADGTNGGNPTLVTWRENPLYLVRNTAEEPLQIIAMIRQPDKRHLLHRQTVQELNYIQCGMILVQSTGSECLPTYLVTGNNHRTVHKGLFFNSREVANVVTVPAQSVCYLVPSAMLREKSKFILTTWLLSKEDASSLSIERLNLKVARQLPAIDHFEMHHKEKDRVDFIVDVPTDVHVLVQQEKPFRMVNGGDAMAEDFIAMYMYNDEDVRICGTSAATNYREIGLVHYLERPGRYALSITCPKGTGAVPCKVAIVAVEQANVRITDPPENARDLGEIDLSFLDQEPEGVPLVDLPIDNDGPFQKMMGNLKCLYTSTEDNADDIAYLERHLNDRACELAKMLIGKDRPKYLPNRDLQRLGPFLNEDMDYMAVEKERFFLKKAPRNAAKMREIENTLRNMADDIAEHGMGVDLGFLDPHYEGIPVDDLEAMNDTAFGQMALRRAELMRNPVANARQIDELEEGMHERARQLAKEMHARERHYLEPEPEHIPLELLPLNEDSVFNGYENELRALNRKPKRDAKAISDLENRLNGRAHEIAEKLKNDERELYLDPEPHGVPLIDLPLDTTPEFHDIELKRLRLRLTDPLHSMETIRKLEVQLNECARGLSLTMKEKLRSFLEPDPYGIPLSQMGLDYDADYMQMEEKLRVLLREPKRNATAIAEIQVKMQDYVDAAASELASHDRLFLDPNPEGRMLQSLFLSENAEFMELDKKRRQLKYGSGDADQIHDLEDQMNDIIHDIAHQMNVDERPEFLSPTFKGIPVRDIPLDEDQSFLALEAKRQVQRRDAQHNAGAIAETEKDLNDRAMYLANEKLSADRGYLDTEPEGVPLRLLPLNTDEHFSSIEVRRVQLKKDSRRNAKTIAQVEEDLNDRAHQLARDLKEEERARFLPPKLNGIPYQELPLDADQPFRDMEIQCLLLRENRKKNASAIEELEEALRERGFALAKCKKEQERAFLEPTPLGVPLDVLPLDSNPAFVAKEDQLRMLRHNPRKNSVAIELLEEELNEMARQIAADDLARSRIFLDSEPQGRLLDELPLNDDPEFHRLEMEHRELKRNPTAQTQKLADLEELMNERAHELAKAMNASERAGYLYPTPRGIPFEKLPLDTDEEFGNLEAQRIVLKQQPTRNKKAIEDIEDALNLRAEELAQEQIQADREFLDKEPEGIPLRYVPLDEDSEFRQLESKRLALKSQNVRTTDPRFRQLEDDMNERAHDIARGVKQEVRESVLPNLCNGIPWHALGLDEDLPFADLENELIRARGDGEDFEKEQNLADAMRKRVFDIAAKMRQEERAQFSSVLGYAPSDLPLDESPVYLEREAELCTLRANPKRNAKQIAELEETLKSMLHQMARERAAQERGFLDNELEGRSVEELNIDEDATFRGLEEQYRRLKKDPYADPDCLADLEQMMNDRAHDLARQKNASERLSYLEAAPRNVPLSELPLDIDEDFARMEAQRAKLRQDPRRNAQAIRAVEDALRSRAAELAEEALKNDRIFLEDEPENVPLRQIPFEQDAYFCELEQERAALKKDPRQNAIAIQNLEEQLNDRVRSLALEVKAEGRSDMTQEPLGIPLAHLDSYLDDDKHFHELEEKYRDAKNDYTKEKIAMQLLEQMNDRVREIASSVHDDERQLLDQAPKGIQLSALPLNEDAIFLELENAMRDAVGSNVGESSLEDLRRQMNARAEVLADELRKTYCDPFPEGIPLELLVFADDHDFTAMETDLRRLKQNPIVNRQKIADLESALNNRAHEKARKMLESDRDYLDPQPADVLLKDIPITADEKFHAMEVRRAVLKAQDFENNRDAIADLETRLNERVYEMAEEIKESEIHALGVEQLGISHTILQSHKDPEFAELAQQLRDLKSEPRRNAAAIREVKDRMAERINQLAMRLLQEDRDYLDTNIVGMDTAVLPLDQDTKFHRQELERAKLKAEDPVRNAKRIEALEGGLRDRARELAEDQKREDLRGLDPAPEGIPLALLNPHADPVFAAQLVELRSLKSNPQSNRTAISAMQKALNKHSREMAANMLREERHVYLEPVIKGVPLELLPLNDDTQFHEMESQRAVLKAQDSHKHQSKIKDLNQRLTARAEELAERQRQKDIESIDSTPHGVPLAVLNVHDDEAFAEMVNQHRVLMQDPKENADELHALEEQMSDRANALAYELVKSERAFLDPEPQGVLLEYLPLDDDATFCALEGERIKLKVQDPRRNARKIKELEVQLCNLAHEMARQQLVEDLREVEHSPRNIPLEYIKPHEDYKFKALVDEARQLRRDPDAEPERLLEVMNEMNERVFELAGAAMDREYLDPEPESVPLEILPLDTDPQFQEMEVERAKLRLRDPIRNARKIKDLEAQLNERARDLAKLQLIEDLSGVDPEPEGIPLELLHLAEDAEIAALIPQLRELRRDPEENAEAINDIEDIMNNRAYALANNLLDGDRDYLDPEPAGVPLEYLPLYTDVEFSSMEVERAKLKATDPRRNARHITELERMLNDRARSLGEKKKKEEQAMFLPQYEGIDTATLRPHEDVEFAAMVNQLRKLSRENETEGVGAGANASEINKLLADMDGRLEELARERKEGDLWFLDKEPEGIPIEEVKVQSDALFVEMQEKRAALKAADPRGNAEQIRNLEEDMNCRAHDLAQSIIEQDFEGVAANPHGIPLELFNLREDPQVARYLVELRRARKSARESKKVQELLEKLNGRVEELAWSALASDRPTYLQAEIHGVPQQHLHLESDPVYNGLEVERAKMKLQNATENAQEIEDLEERLQKRAQELALEVLAEDLKNLNQTPCGLPLSSVKPHANPEFHALAKQSRDLRQDRRRNASKLREVEDKMNALACEMAQDMLCNDRGYLVSCPGGVPLEDLPLDTDPAFHELEVQRAVLKANGVEENNNAIADIEEKLNDCASALAEAQKMEDLRGLQETPNGIPLALLDVHNQDRVIALLPELRRLKKEAAPRNSLLLSAVQAKLDNVLEDLAADYLAKDRMSYLDPVLEGIPLDAVPLDTDLEFKTLEQERFSRIAKDPRINKDVISDLEIALNDRANAIAKTLRRKDRGYLIPDPLSVPLNVLPLDTDRVFGDLETRRAALKAKDSTKNTAAIHDLENQLNDRVLQLAKDQIAADLRDVDALPKGLPVEMIKPHEDAEFARMLNLLRTLKAGDADSIDQQRITDLIADLNDRAHELADAALQDDRVSYLDPEPEGMDLALLPLDSDPVYHQLEVDRAVLKLEGMAKNQAKITALNERLNEQAHELAKGIMAKDLEDLEAEPFGVPVAILHPHRDKAFLDLANQRRAAGGQSDAEDLLRNMMNDLLETMARELLTSNRTAFLEVEPEGMPWSALPLSTDEKFHAMEVERAVLKAEGARANAEKITDLERKLNARAHELAKEVLCGDRDYLEPAPEGVPLEDLPLDKDFHFHTMEVERAKLKASDAQKNSERVAELENRLNNRAYELARKQLREDLEGIDPLPRGIPLDSLAPHSDTEFSAFLHELRKLRQDPLTSSGAKVKELHAKMNNRADELAKEKIEADRYFLDSHPEGLPLSQLPLDSDKAFLELEKRLRAASKDPDQNWVKITYLQEQMSERVSELARELIQGDRGYLDAEPQGVPLAFVPIDTDTAFRQMEAQRALLREDEEANADAIAALEAELNARAHELAAAQKAADREFLNPTSHGIQKELLPLDDDAAFKKMEQQVRRLAQDPRRNATAIENIQELMQERADEMGEVLLKGERERYLDTSLEGIHFNDLPLDTDPTYHQMEVQRATLQATDASGNAEKISELEGDLNARANELAKEQRLRDRSFLEQEPEHIPLSDVPLNSDIIFMRMEEHLRKLMKNLRRNGPAIRETQEKMRDRVHELARTVVASDLACLPQSKYRGISKEDLQLHANPKFCDAANRRRSALRHGHTPPQQIAIIGEEMDALAREIADDVVENERAFLDREPEGMALADLPLDDDKEFGALEAERRRRLKDHRSARRAKDLIRDLESRMKERAAQMAREEYAKMRGFLEAEPEGVPLAKLPLDTDPDFREAEVARYRLRKDPSANPKKVTEVENRMSERVRALAKRELARDRDFLDAEPEGVPLAFLPLRTDAAFSELAKQRCSLKNSASRDTEAMARLEEALNDRAHELAQEYLAKNREYLDREPHNVPIADVPLNRDPVFREMENELLRLKKDPRDNADAIAQLQADLNVRAKDLACDLLRKERAMQYQEPCGVALAELPLNVDPVLNQFERKRRDLKKSPKKNAEALNRLEMEIEDRVNQIAKDFLEKERSFLDPKPEGVPLACVPLDDDRDFQDMSKTLRELKKQPAKNKDAIDVLQEQMAERAHKLAKEQLAKDRNFMDHAPLGVPLSELPLNTDAIFKGLEEKRRALKKDPRSDSKAIHDVEKELKARAQALAAQRLEEERAFLPTQIHGVPLKELPLGKDKQFLELERKLRELRKEPKKNAAPIKTLEDDMRSRAETLAKRHIADDRAYLNPEPLGVPLADLNLANDAEFCELEWARREAKKAAEVERVQELEDNLKAAVMRIATNFLKQERAYLDPETEGVPLEELPLNEDADFRGMEADRRKLKKNPKKNAQALQELEDRLKERARALAKEKKGYQDPSFHEACECIAEQWPRIREIYPEGLYDQVTPTTTSPSDVRSASQDMGFLAPFIAALARHTVLISRLFQDKAHPQNQPYRITLFNPDSSPVTVEIDDRVPCDDNRNSKFTQAASRRWYPLLLEKAYAKFVGGYEHFNNCNAHDTLRDLTGRPVLHISFENPKHAAATNMVNYTTAGFWRRVIEDLGRGDIFVCVANSEVPDGFHPHCSYALMDVIEMKRGTTDPNDIIIKVHNCYFDEPIYKGPLRPGDCNWTAEARHACSYSEEETDMIYMPLSVFLSNFSCMQRCHINCGDRLTSPGEWNEYTSGGTFKYTTFRRNPIYLVENKTSRPATIFAEVRHVEPLYMDENNCKRYPYTGLTLMQPHPSKLLPTPLITGGTHKALQKGMMLDSREVCAEMELPPSSTCYLIPYTKDRGTHGKFFISIYPDMARVTLTPLRYANLTLQPLCTNVKLQPTDADGARLDFVVNSPCDVHIMLHQTKITDMANLRRGDVVAEDDVLMAAFNEYGIKIGSTGEAANRREQSLIFKAPQAGRYSLLIVCTGTSTEGPCTAYVEIFTPTNVEAQLIATPADAKPLTLHGHSRFPTLTRTATAPNASRAASRERTLSAARNVRRTDSVPPINGVPLSTHRGSPDASAPRRVLRGRR